MLMDFVEGSDLRSEIFELHGKGMPAARVLEIMPPIVGALNYAHAKGYIHCDLKPGNVMVHKNGTVLVTDFGIARMTDAATATLVGFGTPAYMAPELVRGKEPSPQTDIYALGAMLFEMLTGGERPFTGEQAEVTGSTSDKVRWEQVNLEPPSPKKWNKAISPELEQVVLKCLAKQPGRRFGSVLELMNALVTSTGEEAAPLTDRPAEAVPAVAPVPPMEKAEPELPPRKKAPEVPKPERGGRLPLWAWAAGGSALAVLLLIMVVSLGGQYIRGAGEEKARQTAAALALEQTRSAAQTATARPTATLTPTATATPTSTPTLAPTPKPGIGSTMVSPVDGMVMVYVPEGTFLMGSDRSDQYADNDEFPQHEVYLDSFWIDRTEVTNAMYAAFLNARGNHQEGGVPWLGAGEEDPRIQESGGMWEADAGYEDHPVVEVSWYGARAYCEWAGRRLPTEAEWEKAARGMNGGLYPWGEANASCSKVNLRGCMGDTAEVGSYADGASPYGAWDMAGNVYEWVADWYDADYYESSPAENPLGPEGGTWRVMRGGWWFHRAGQVRSAFRNRADPNAAGHHLGFRCAGSP
jgi:formylglycine-generating enzyme required for sulfatase activity